MKRVFRWLFRLLILGVVLAVALVLLKDILLKAWAERRIRQQTGCSVTIHKLEAGLLAPTLTLEGLKLYNPPAFGGSVLLDVPEIHLEYDPWKAAGGKLHFRLLRFNLKELNLVKNAAGQTNVFSLLASAKPSPTTNQPAGPKPNKSSSQRSGLTFDGIERLYLSVGAIRFTDQAQPASSWVRPVGWKDYEIKSIRTAQDGKNWAMLLFLQVAVIAPQPWPGGVSR